MKIADFFIALGFDIKGAPDVEKTDQAVQKLEVSSLKLLAVTTALNAAFYAMMKNGVEVGLVLQRFALTTGLSTQELQRNELAAVRGNVAARSMAEALGTIQKARVAIAFGNGEAAAPWMLLGIDPRQDPFKVLEALRQRILSLDPAIARQKLSEMGFGDDIMFLLKQPGAFGGARLDRRLIVSDEEAKRLASLGAAWKEFLFTVGQVGARFAAQFAEPLAAVLNQLSKALVAVGRFVDWLDRGSAGADAFKYAVLGLLVVMGGLNAALGLLIIGPVGAFVGLLAIMAVALGTLVLLIQDFWVQCRGGKSAFDWNENLLFTVRNVERLARAIEWCIAQWHKLSGLNFGGTLAFAQGGGFGSIALPPNLGAPAGGAASGPVTQTNSITNNINGAGDPHAVGREVGRSTTRQVSDAFAQMPLPAR